MADQAGIYEKTERVKGFECGFDRRWKPAAFFQHLTEAAGEHAEALGFGFDAMLAKNLFWVHSRMKIKFFEFPEPHDLITIRTWPKTVQQKLFFVRDFEVMDDGGRRIAAATSAWLVIDAATRHLVPTHVLNLNLPATPERSGLDEPLEKLAVAQAGEEKLKVRAGYSAVDMLGHVNNSRYVEWICDCFPLEEYRNYSLDWIQINYDHEVRSGEEVALLASRSGRDSNLWTIEGVNLSNQARAFEAALSWRERS